MPKILSQTPARNMHLPSQHESQFVNTHWAERWLTGIGGTTLGTYGLFRRDWPGMALAVIGGALLYRGISGHSFAYQGLGINTRKRSLPSQASVPHQQGVRVEKTITIERPAQELYRFWRHFENLPSILDDIQEIQILDEMHSHWVIKAPAGMTVEWDAEIIHEEENERLAWRSLPGSSLAHAGSVHFSPAPDKRGTEVRVEMEYMPPAGRPGRLVAKLLRKEPAFQTREGLRHFKELMEAGEIPTTHGQPTGRHKHRE